jgi:hypothetical protein
MPEIEPSFVIITNGKWRKRFITTDMGVEEGIVGAGSCIMSSAFFALGSARARNKSDSDINPI